MKHRTTATALIIFVLLSCGPESSKHQTPDVPLPAPLEESNASFKSLKRGQEDMVEILYADLLKKSRELQQLELRLDSMGMKVSDSTAAYEKFDNVNERYYNSVINHLEQIGDSILNQQIQRVVDQSKARYHLKVATHEQLAKTIMARQREIADLSEAIKVILTIPEMQKYQDKALPSSRPMQELIEEHEKIKSMLEAVRRKNNG